MTITLPQGFVVRGATMDDLAAVAELLVMYEKAYYSSSDSTQASMEEWVQSVWESPGFDLARDSFVVSAPGGICVGYVTVWIFAMRKNCAGNMRH